MRNSTLIVGVVVTLALLALGTFVIEPLLPHFKHLSYLPACAFVAIYISGHRSRPARATNEDDDHPASN